MYKYGMCMSKNNMHRLPTTQNQPCSWKMRGAYRTFSHVLVYSLQLDVLFSILFLVSETATKCTEDHQREAYQGYLVSPNMDRQTA